MSDAFTPSTVTFADGATWTYATPTSITYSGPLGPNRWEWRTPADAAVAWLAICTH